MDLLFSSLSIKRFIYVILVAILACIGMVYAHHHEAYWLVWSAFIMSLITTGDSFKRRVTTILITGFAAAFVAWLASIIQSPLLLALYLFVITIICVSLAYRRPVTFFQAFIINLFAILSACLHVPFGSELARFIFICGGVMIAALLQMVFYPYFIRNELQPYLVISIRNLKKINKDIFTCLLQPDYPDNVYLYERRLHLAKTNFLRALQRLRDITILAEMKLSESEKASHDTWLSRLNELFENMMDYSQLRRRISDYSTLSLCAEELAGISREIGVCLDAIIAHLKRKKFFPNTNKLNEYIQALERQYHQVLQVASPEPLAFVLFIDSLTTFSKTMEALYANAIPASSHLS